jgi:hypothetical protein
VTQVQALAFTIARLQLASPPPAQPPARPPLGDDIGVVSPMSGVTSQEEAAPAPLLQGQGSGNTAYQEGQLTSTGGPVSPAVSLQPPVVTVPRMEPRPGAGPTTKFQDDNQGALFHYVRTGAGVYYRATRLSTARALVLDTTSAIPRSRCCLWWCSCSCCR